ncbi:hypothetical protein LP030nr2_069 [Listeria phage LP-030-2]|uniref:Uncharacterized protein n=1 Tax=Listeria phage LP-030-2 TaxID=1173743 RepID=W0G8K9_9CAUD|nr:hypothetical protein LP030nr2_069 [Listeria phage LP-030-2]AHF53421.1 hypothetical protein LP030nr2_069 [Listeria phage LP-030-2]
MSPISRFGLMLQGANPCRVYLNDNTFSLFNSRYVLMGRLYNFRFLTSASPSEG